MAGERKENSVLFTLKELKDITADEAAVAPTPSRDRPAKKRGFIDEADSLLADIRNSVDADAAAEAARLAAEREALAQAETRQREAQRSAKREQAQTRLAAEEARRRAAAEDREARAHAIDIAERRARGEIIEEPEVKVAVFPQPAAPAAPTQPEPQGRGTSFYLTVVGLPVLCLTAVAIALILKPADVPPAAPQAELKPAVVTMTPATEAPIPDPVLDEPEEPDAAVPDAAVPDAGKKPAKKRRRNVAAKKPPVKKKKKKGLQLNLGGDKGGITF